ncbi:FecR domain-containing protein [Lentisalinibacter orientalis]|uniref:FecR domain-containing protein n=1 Tax=Lentisalinibacter orientalis TaxID=2992241 RepID=UPI00386F9723
MSEEQRTDRDGKPRPIDEATARLIAHGRPRRAIPPGAQERVHATVHEAWRDATRERRRRQAGRRWHLPIALAASVALAGILIARFPAETVAPAAPVATVVVVRGELSGADGTRLRPGDELAAGSSLSTDGAGRAALSLADGTSLRVDHDTRMTLTADARLRLDAGAVYVDTAPAGSAGDGVTIVTAYAAATDLGTQFEVRLAGEAALIRVREGKVAIAPGPAADTGSAAGAPGHHVAPAGRAALVSAAGGIETSDVSPNDPSWAWAQSVAPAFETAGGRKLGEFLSWSARELGLELHYSGDTGAAAAAVDLSGSVEGMTPGEALQAVMATTTLAYRVEDGRLEVYRP